MSLYKWYKSENERRYIPTPFDIITPYINKSYNLVRKGLLFPYRYTYSVVNGFTRDVFKSNSEKCRTDVWK